MTIKKISFILKLFFPQKLVNLQVLKITFSYQIITLTLMKPWLWYKFVISDELWYEFVMSNVSYDICEKDNEIVIKNQTQRIMWFVINEITTSTVERGLIIIQMESRFKISHIFRWRTNYWCLTYSDGEQIIDITTR